MCQTTVTVHNRSGLHARPAALLVKTAGKFNSSIRIENNGKAVDGKSIFGVLSLSVKQGDTITIYADGNDEKQALQEIVSVIKSGLGEK